MLTSVVLTTLCFALVVWWQVMYRERRRKRLKRSVAILVLGDIGRSPRMMYHAGSFLKANFETYLVGYGGSKAIPSLRDVHFVYLPDPLHFPHLPFIISGPIKVLHQIAAILHAFTNRIPNPPEFILVQNPPSIPTLALVWLVGRIRGCKVIVDWHNLGYSILALKLGNPRHPFVLFSKIFERVFGRSAYAHLFVTHAMHDHLVKTWNLQGHKAVLHDRPPRHFHKASPPEIHELFLRIRENLPAHLYTSFFPPSSPPYSTPFTHIEPTPSSSSSTGGSKSSPSSLSPPSPTHKRRNMPSLRPDRPALLVSSTSWTPDEDFSILLDALRRYERRACEREASAQGALLPKVLVVITGKGPLKETYMAEVRRLQHGDDGEKSDGWKWVRCIDMWLEAEDYPLLLGSADLGVCLHSSSSALDLPMKIVDMFGCGLPVCALDFACLGELVKDGQNGRVFQDAIQLAEQLETLLTSFPDSPGLTALRSSFTTRLSTTTTTTSTGEWEWSTWEENWSRIVLPLVSGEVSQ